jgi:hypothetical protein
LLELAMSLVLLLIGVAAVTVAVAGVVSGGSAIHSALAAGERTAVGLGDPAAETLSSETSAKSAKEWQLTTVDNLTAAEELLDLLENQGFAEREVVILGNARFAVRWR